jgi:hypothetical protein
MLAESGLGGDSEAVLVREIEEDLRKVRAARVGEILLTMLLESQDWMECETPEMLLQSTI